MFEGLTEEEVNIWHEIDQGKDEGATDEEAFKTVINYLDLKIELLTQSYIAIRQNLTYHEKEEELEIIKSLEKRLQKRIDLYFKIFDSP